MQRRIQDCVIVGAGPAGLSAAIWLEQLGIRTTVLESGDSLGGELERIRLPIRNYLGLGSLVGSAFLQQVSRQISARQIAVQYGARVTGVCPKTLTVTTGDKTYRARTLILAMGLRRRTLDVTGAAELVNRGVSYSATGDLEQIRGQAVAVVGGGDGAVENALILAEVCPKVFLLHRGDKPTAHSGFVERLKQQPKITVIGHCQIQSLKERAGGLASVVVQTSQHLREIEVAWLVVKIGFEPRTESITKGALRLDKGGYIEVDRYMHTSVPGVFAAGDVCNPRDPCIASAVGDGAMAARQIRHYLQHKGVQ